MAWARDCWVEWMASWGHFHSSDMCLSLQGGPCGVLAAVQGSVLQKLLFEGDNRTNSNL